MSTRQGIGLDWRINVRLLGSVDRFDRALRASILTCNEQLSKRLTRYGMVPDAPMANFLTGDADRVTNAATACSCIFGFSDWRKPTIGSKAPASTMQILLLQENRKIILSKEKGQNLIIRLIQNTKIKAKSSKYYVTTMYYCKF